MPSSTTSTAATTTPRRGRSTSRGQIESLRAQGRIGESNDLVPAQNAAADEVNALVDQGVALEDQYDAVVTEYNAVVSSAHELYDAISAVPPTAPTS